jgi:hypothetical protein
MNFTVHAMGGLFMGMSCHCSFMVALFMDMSWHVIVLFMAMSLETLFTMNSETGH